MRKSALASFLALALVLVVAAPGLAGGGHTRVFVGVGPAFWWGPPYPYGWYPPPYYVYAQPQVVVQEPPVYIQREPSPPPAPPAAQADWYYCPSAEAYYPDVAMCSEAWVKVPAQPR